MPRQMERRVPSPMTMLKSVPWAGMVDYISTEVSQQNKQSPAWWPHRPRSRRGQRPCARPSGGWTAPSRGQHPAGDQTRPPELAGPQT